MIIYIVKVGYMYVSDCKWSDFTADAIDTVELSSRIEDIKVFEFEEEAIKVAKLIDGEVVMLDDV